MLWLKRNLFLAVGGLLALLMLGSGGYYLWTNYQNNSKVEHDLQEKRTTLQAIYNDKSKPFPNETNIATAKAELERVRKVVQQSKTYFAPIVPPPVSPQEFRILLDNVIYELRRRAEQQGIGLPGRNYAFSFEAQRKGLTFGPGTFPAMPELLAEVHSLCSVLFDAQINRLIGVRRTRVSTDDESNKGAPDYHELAIQTNATTKCVSTPYMCEFQCFSEELANIVEGLQKSTNGFVLKSILIEPSPASVADPTGAPPNVAPGTPGAPPPPPGQPLPPGYKPPVAVKPPAADPFGKTIIDQRPLKVMMMVEVIKCRTTDLQPPRQ